MMKRLTQANVPQHIEVVHANGLYVADGIIKLVIIDIIPFVYFFLESLSAITYNVYVR